MNLLIFPQYAFPTNHAVVNTVYEQLLPARGHAVHMVRPMAGVDGPRRIPAPWPGGTQAVYPYEPPEGRLGNVVRGMRRSRWVADAIRLLDDVAFDAILVRNDLLSASAAVRLARQRRIPFIFQISSPDAEFTMTRGRELGGLAGLYPRWRGRYGLAVRRWASRRASAVLAISDAMRDHLVAVDGLDPQKVFSFPMGVIDDEASGDAAAARCLELRLPAGRTIVYSGTIDPVRQPQWMLDVFDRVRARVSDAVLLVIAREMGEHRRVFEEEARRRGGDVRVVGPLPFRDVGAYLRCCAVMLAGYPPMLEHRMVSPTKSLEGIGAGLPVVGSAEVLEHDALFRASGGGVCVEWDRDRFADVIVSLLQDPERRRHMGQQGRNWVLAHRTYQHLTTYLERILEASPSASALSALPHAP